jgi:hypothetical protein
MILEPKHKNFKGPVQSRETVKTIYCQAQYVHTKGFELYYFKVILNWWHSPFNLKS